MAICGCVYIYNIGFVNGCVWCYSDVERGLLSVFDVGKNW